MTTTDGTFTKDPAAVLDYQWDWSSWLAVGDTIASHTVTVPTGITLDSSIESAGKVTAWLSGGTDGTYYPVTCKIVTAAGRTDERSIIIKCKDR